MTEAEWLTCTAVQRMRRFLMQANASERKMRLFACACCREIWHSLTDERSRNAVEVAERFADDEETERELARVATAALEASADVADDPASAPPFAAAAWTVASGAYMAAGYGSAAAAATTSADPTKQPAILREIVGNPFRRPQSIPPRASQVTREAQLIYDERAYARLPVLADMLEEVGIHDVDLLDHLRDSGPHVRGCWALDHVLGVF